MPTAALLARAAAVRSPRLATGAALTAGLGLVATVDPHGGGRYPPCLWHATTGTWCPGCGALRATYDLAHGQLAAAAGENALVVAAAVLVPLVWLAQRTGLGRSPRHRRRWPLTQRAVVLVLSGAALLFAVLRNLPVGAALAP